LQNTTAGGFFVFFGMRIILEIDMIQQLCKFEEDGIINRITYTPKVEYELTEYGWSLQPILDSFVYGAKFILSANTETRLMCSKIRISTLHLEV